MPDEIGLKNTLKGLNIILGNTVNHRPVSLLEAIKQVVFKCNLEEKLNLFIVSQLA